MQTVDQIDLFGKTLAELEDCAADWGFNKICGRQLFHWMYARGTSSFSKMTNLSRASRNFLEASCAIRLPKISGQFYSQDGTVRYLLELSDQNTIETVYIPDKHRDTFCLSSQVGCPLDCQFCFTALLGRGRDLTVGEIVGQVFAVRPDLVQTPNKRLNIVFMGMGEPFLNYSNLISAIQILSHPKGLGISPRRITVSTAGVIPGIHSFSTEPNRSKLAVSLNASSQKQRVKLMPITRKYPLAGLIEACREFPLNYRERLTFEYIMLGGINDSNQDASRLVGLLKGIRSKVNLIPYNPGPELSFQSSSMLSILSFQKILKSHGILAFVRRPRGQDIRAACGQLSLTRNLPITS